MIGLCGDFLSLFGALVKGEVSGGAILCAWNVIRIRVCSMIKNDNQVGGCFPRLWN